VIRKFILWESGRAAELSGLPDAVASQVRQVADSQTTEAIDVATFPLPTQLALRRHLSLSQKGGEIALSNELGVPSLSLATTITLEDLQLSVRSTNCLRAASIRTLDDLLLWTAPELKDLQFFGAKCLREITEILAQMGCSLADSVQPRGSSASEGIFKASVAPLPLVLRFDEFISDPTTLDSLHQAGWRFVNDLSMLSLEEVSSRARLNQERSESLETSLQEFGVNIPSRVPEWLNENLATVRSAFQKEISAYIASLEIGSESSLTVSPAVSLHDELVDCRIVNVTEPVNI
jgi:Bacterial RNA polymerase, alpha chain C terminal domain